MTAQEIRINQEIQAKALELVFFIQSQENENKVNHGKVGLFYRYRGLVADIERFIRQGFDS